MIYRFLLLLVLLPSIAFTYTVVRKDGKVFQGELVQQTSESISIKEKDGTVLKFKSSQIDWNKTTVALQDEEKSSRDRNDVRLTTFETREIDSGPVRGSRNKWKGEPISIEFKDVDVRDFFRFLADMAKMNLILDPDVKGNLTIKMVDVPWDQVLDVVCRNFGWGYEIEGNVVSLGR